MYRSVIKMTTLTSMKTLIRYHWLVGFALLVVGCGAHPAATAGSASPAVLPSPRTTTRTLLLASAPASAATPAAISTRSWLPGGATTPVGTRPACWAYAIDGPTYPGLAGYAWGADQIVVGTVIAQEARWETLMDRPAVFTYSLVRVTERARGLPGEALVLREAGGTLDGCTQRGSQTALITGVTYVLFLLCQPDTMSSSAAVPTCNRLSGAAASRRVEESQGISWVTTDGARQPLQQVLDDIRVALAQPPPRLYPPSLIIPLDRAPLAPTPTPQP